MIFWPPTLWPVSRHCALCLPESPKCEVMLHHLPHCLSVCVRRVWRPPHTHPHTHTHTHTHTTHTHTHTHTQTTHTHTHTHTLIVWRPLYTHKSQSFGANP